MLFDHFAEGLFLFLRQRPYGSEHHCPDEVREVILPEHFLEVGENDPFGFVEADTDSPFALAVEVVETIVVDDFRHIRYREGKERVRRP